MANPEHLAILLKGVSEWHAWRRKNLDVMPDLRGAKLADKNLIDANLRGAYLSEINFSGADLRGADLSASDLSHADMREANLKLATLRGTNLTLVDLQEASLRQADLAYADLTYADLRGATLINADLADADLRSANLAGADLHGADLTDADLRGANLRYSHFNNNGIQNTNFERADCGHTLFTNVDLSSALGLDTIMHYGPTSIGIDTLYRSGGNIPREFLEGCGVPENMITFAKSLVGQAIEYYSCFISHSTQDSEFCDRLAHQMKREQLRVWYAPEDMKYGDKVYTQIDEAIRLHDKLIIILSEASIKSNWVQVEIQRALKREKLENRRVLFPVLLINYENLKNWDLVDSNGVDMAEEIRRYYMPDFSAWKEHDKFTAIFKKFLADLRKNE